MSFKDKNKNFDENFQIFVYAYNFQELLNVRSNETFSGFVTNAE